MLTSKLVLRDCLPSSRWPRDTVNMQSIELVAILVAPSDLQNFFPGAAASARGPLWKGKWKSDP